MNSEQPILLVRAKPKPEVAEKFGAWFRNVHMQDARAIPGFSSVESGRTAGGTWLAIYTFESAESVQVSLASPEASYARGTWEQWAGDLDELLIEMFATLSPLPIYQAPS